MNDREIMKLALDALENLYDTCDWHGDDGKEAMLNASKAIITIKEALAQPEQEPVAHYVIAGVLFDFMGWLTSRKERLVLSSADEASPAVDAIRDFAKMRGLSLEDAKVQEWTDKIRART